MEHIVASILNDTVFSDQLHLYFQFLFSPVYSAVRIWRLISANTP